MKIIVYTDGAARGNPGPAAASFIIRNDRGEILLQDGVFLGIATNNEAEYAAVKLALEKFSENLPTHLSANIEIRADSRLIVEQLSGNFKIKNERLKVLFNQVRGLEEKVGQVSYTYIPREENYQADQLANQILDSQS